MTKSELKMAETMIDAATEILKLRNQIDKLTKDNESLKLAPNKYNNDIYECADQMHDCPIKCQIKVDKGDDSPCFCPYTSDTFVEFKLV